LLLSSSSQSSPDYNLHHHTFSLPIEKVVHKTMHSCNVQFPNKPPAVNLNDYEQAITNKTSPSTPNKFSFYFPSSGAPGPNMQCALQHMEQDMKMSCQTNRSAPVRTPSLATWVKWRVSEVLFSRHGDHLRWKCQERNQHRPCSTDKIGGQGDTTIVLPIV
jgi:hypothetical protein